MTFAVFSHCFNPWLKFKGGRGLATAAGGAVLVFPFLLVVWCILWVIFYLMKRDIIFANILSTIFSSLLVYGTTNIAIKYAYPPPLDISTLIMVSTAVLLIIFIKHIEPLNELISKTKKMEK